MKPNFRNMARIALEKAKFKMGTADEDDLLDATLRLRMAMEALIYERAANYADELGPEQMKTWQPKILMDRMLEIDPYADQSVTLSYGIEPSYGETPEKMTLLGTDQPLNQATLKKHYDALGSYLHTPTLDQLENNKPHDMQKLRVRCETIVAAIEQVLSSRVWGKGLSHYRTFECHACKTVIKRRLSHDVERRKIECWKCMATYNMSHTSDGNVSIEPRRWPVTCVAENCETETFIWEKELTPGRKWECQDCGTPQKLDYCVVLDTNNLLPDY